MATKTDLRVVLSVDGQRAFSATMKNVAEQQKIIRAEAKKAASELKDGGTAYEKARIQAEKLTKQIEQQEIKVKTLKDALETTTSNEKKFAEQAASTKRAYEAAKAQLDEWEASLRKSGATEDEIKEKLADEKERVKKLGEEYNNAENRIRANADAQTDLKLKLTNSTTELNNMRSALEKANQKMVEHEEKAEKAAKKLKDFGTDAEFVGQKLETAGGKMTKYLTTSILGAGAFASKAAIEYEDAFAGVVKTVDGTKEELEELNNQILDMSTELPTSATEIAGVAEAAGQLGIEVGNIKNFTEVMVGLGMSTNLSSEEAASALAKFANVTKMSARDYGRLGSTVVDLGNNFATTERDIVEMATRLASTGEIVGYSQPQMMAIATALSSVGIEAEAGGSAFSKLSKNLELAVTKGGNDLKKWSDVAGVSAAEFKKAYEKDALGALSMFINGLNDTERNGKNAVEILDDMGITEVRMSNAVLALASSEGILDEAVQTANKAWTDNSALQTEVGKRTETTGSKLTMAKNELTKTAVLLGDTFLPTIAEVAKNVGELAEGFNELDDETKQNIVKFALVAAGAGPVIKVFGSLTTGIGKTASSASNLIKVTKAVKAGTYTGPLNKVLSALVKTSGATGGLASSSTGLLGILSAGAPVIIGFAGAAAVLYGAYRKLTEGDRAVTEGVEKMLSGFGKWDEAVQNGTNLLSNLNSEIIVSAEESAKISGAMDTVQGEITAIARTASDERRKLKDGEIERLDELFKKMSELSGKELEMQQAYQDAAIAMAETTTDYSYENVADLVATAQQTKDKTIELAKQQQAEKLVLLKKAYEDEGSISAEEYERKQQEAQQEYDLAVQSANEKFAKVNEITTQGYFEQNIKGNENLQSLINLNQQYTANEQSYRDEIARIASDASLTEDQRRQQQYLADWNYRQNKKSIQDQMSADMENLNSDELAAWIEMSSNTAVYGGQITAENQQTFDNFIGIYDNLPSKAKKKFRETMQGMIDGIKEKTGELFNKASEIADGFINKITTKFDIHSPSRVMYKIFGQVAEGGIKSVEDNKERLFDEADSMSEGFIERLDDLPSDLFGQISQETLSLADRLINQINEQPFIVSQLKGKVAAHQASVVNNSTVSHDNSSHFDAILKIENMTVRNDSDIRKLSNQIESLTRNTLIGKGQKV